MSNIISERSAAPAKPCLVETGRGFSVSYNNRFLYSKYDPKKNIENFISNLNILPGTLITVISPLLWYGLETLLSKLPEDCFILAVEKNEDLYEFSKEELKKLTETNPSITSKVKLISPEKLDLIVNLILNHKVSKEDEIPPVYNFRRTVPVEFSGGSSLNGDFYKALVLTIQNTIGSFWKNRLTLTKLGRLYSRNIIKNLSLLPDSTRLEDIKNTVAKPVFVFGAGESTVETLKEISSDLLKNAFVIAVDAALPVLASLGIIPDAVVAVEGQLAIEKAYIGNNKINTLFFADMASRKSVLRHSKGEICFFASEYADTNFFDNLKSFEFFPKTIPALGSVGLTAVYIALILRASYDVPVFVSGLDFSYSLGSTHAKNAPAHINRLLRTSRFSPVENYAAAFKNDAFMTCVKNEKKYFSDAALSGYAKSFADVFYGQKNLYNCTEFGLNIGLPFVQAKQAADFIKAYPAVNNNKADAAIKNKKTEILDYLKEEEKALNRIKELLMFGKDVESCSVSINQELEDLISKREYLFLHFPDGFKCRTADLDFLKRIRSELDFFLKDIKKSIRELMQ